MVRTQVSLTEAQAEGLKRIASRRGVSMSAIVREAVDQAVAREELGDRWMSALSVVGKYSSGRAIEEVDHDDEFVRAVLDER